MITDCHVHPRFLVNDGAACDAAVAHVLACMGRAGIDRCVLTPMTVGRGGWLYPGMDETAFTVETLAAAKRAHPGRFYSLIWVNPYHGDDFLFPLIEGSFRSGAIDGVKLLTEMNVRDERIGRLAAFLEARDIPVLIHCFYNTEGPSLFESNPSDIVYLAERHPGLRIVMAHLKGCGFRGMQEVRPYPNISVDTSGAWPEDGYLEYTMDALGSERILFGSDYPGRDMAVAAGRVESVGMPEADRDNIFYRNADRVFGGGGRA